MIETILMVIFASTTLISIYVIINLYTKCDNLEQWVNSTYLLIQQTLQTMKDIDATEHFQTDDEVEEIFKLLETTLNQLENTVEEQND
jgi:predicted PurR-regulated permease PerM